MTGTPLLLARRRRDLSQSDVASAVGITQGFYAKLELRESAASPETAARLATYFGHDVTEMQILYPERYMVEEEAKCA